ncbi:retrovirus-related pol polyprotein from transposon TNT 1-94 [Tanacetum coccineum]
MAAEVPQTLEYMGGQLNVAPILELVKGSHDQMKSVINCLTTKSTWDDLILYHEGLSDVKESEVMDLKLCYNTFKFKEDSPDDEEDTRSSHEYLNDLEEEYQARALLANSKRFFKEGTQRFNSAKATDQTECQKCSRKGHFARNCSSKTTVPSYQSPFQPELLNSSEHKPELRHTKKFKAKYNKVKAKLTLLSSSASAPKSSSGKNKGLIAKTYEYDEEEVSSGDNEVTEVKALMALTTKEKVSVGKECASNDEWVKISIQKVHTLLEMEDNDDRKSFLDYLCIDRNYVKEQRNNLLSKHRNLVQELNTCKEQLLVLKQVKLDLLTMQHVNTEILKENQNLRNELKELTSIIETWLNSSKSISGPKDLIFVKSSVDNSNMSITSSNKPRLSEAEDSTLPNRNTGKVPSDESQRNMTDPSVVVSDSPATDYDSADESSDCSTPLPPLEKLDGVIINEPSSALAKGNINTLVSKTNSVPAGKLKNVKIEYDLPLAIVIKELNEIKLQISKNKSSYSRNKNSQQINQHHIGPDESSSRSRPSRPTIPFPSCIHCGYNDHQFDDYVYYPICKLCGSYDHDTHGHNRIISLRRGIKPRNPQHVTKNCKTCGSNVHTITDHDDIEWFRKREALQAKKAKTFKTIARLKAIRIFLAFATYMNFIAYQMDFKSAFLNSKLKDVYVKQPPGFESSEFPNHVCKLSKALYGLKQAPRAWHFNQPNKYVKDLLRKYDINGSSVKTSMVPPNKLGPDLNGKAVNETQYRGMIRSLMYLIASRPDIQFSTYLYARYQANPTESHLIDVKRIFRFLKGTPSLGLWYLKCSGFNQKGYSDSDYAGCNMDRKSTYDACQLLGGKLVCWSAKKQQSVAMCSAEVKYVAVAGCFANILWMKSQLTDYDIIYEKAPIFCDNISAIAISNNPVMHSRTNEYVAPPSIDIVRPWFKTIGYGETVPTKGTLEKSLLPPRWRLLMAQIIQCLGGKIRGFDQITNKDAIILYSLANRINTNYASIFWEDIIIKLNKKHRGKFVPYTRFLSLLMMHKMKEGYGDGEVTSYPTQVFSVC